ncbi:MAG: hypothetical protein LBV18_04855 [Alistipes sp.]|nr:hypothetical protein [Alistipes sp.]
MIGNLFFPLSLKGYKKKRQQPIQMKLFGIILLLCFALPTIAQGQEWEQSNEQEPVREHLIDSITVSGGKTRLVKLGRSSGGTRMFATPFFFPHEISRGDRTGLELGTPIKIKHDSKILSFKMLIANNEYTSAKFRISFYSFDGETPGAKIVDEEIAFELKEGAKGWFELDLTPYNIWFAGGQEIILSLTLTDDGYGEGPNIFWLNSAFGKTLFRRVEGSERWETLAGTVALTMFLNAKMYL